jgi:hypothetical protein
MGSIKGRHRILALRITGNDVILHDDIAEDATSKGSDIKQFV